MGQKITVCELVEQCLINCFKGSILIVSRNIMSDVCLYMFVIKGARSNFTRWRTTECYFTLQLTMLIVNELENVQNSTIKGHISIIPFHSHYHYDPSV